MFSLRGRRPVAAGAALLTASLVVAISGGPVPHTGAAIVAVNPTAAPAFADGAPDPAVVRAGSTYYAYTTGTKWGNHIGVLTSTSPASGWRTSNGAKFGSTALPTIPNWQRQDTQNAPGVFNYAGRWIMFYNAVDKSSGNACLSIATATSPVGPFRDDSAGPWLCQPEFGGAIDASPFVDADGRAWLTWKTNDGSSTQPARLWSAPLDATGTVLAGAPVVLLTQDTVHFPWETTIENPQLVLAGGTYVLLFSGGIWDSTNYVEGYAFCSGPAGPCIQNRDPFLSSYGSVAGPGGASAFTDTSGAWWLAYHGWTAGCTSYSCNGQRRLYVAPLQIGSGVIRVGCAAPASPAGYRAVGANGAVFSYGNLPYCGSMGDSVLNAPMIATAPTPNGGGYWLVAADGGVFSFGNAQFFGSTGAMRLNQPIVGMAPTPDGGGYWMVARDGGIFSFGNARFFGSTGAMRLNQPIVGMAAAPDGAGYWLVARDGGIFTFGSARFFGSTGALKLNQPIVGMAATPDGAGYWLVARDGGIFTFGSARFFGSTGALKLNQPIIGMTATRTAAGYLFIASDGGIFTFGDAQFLGAPASMPIAAPIVGLA